MSWLSSDEDAPFIVPDCSSVVRNFDDASLGLRTNFTDAEECCVTLGGLNMAPIHSVEEQEQAFAACEEVLENHPSTCGCWVGALRLPNEDFNIFDDGSLFDFDNFVPGERDQDPTAEACVYMDPSSGGKWRTVACDGICDAQSNDLPIALCLNPTRSPTSSPTFPPSPSPTKNPTTTPTISPTQNPTTSPTKNPTHNPTTTPTKNPTASPTISPTKNPTTTPTESPTINPTTTPTRNPSQSPTFIPTGAPTLTTTPNPTIAPTIQAESQFNTSAVVSGIFVPVVILAAITGFVYKKGYRFDRKAVLEKSVDSSGTGTEMNAMEAKL